MIHGNLVHMAQEIREEQFPHPVKYFPHCCTGSIILNEIAFPMTIRCTTRTPRQGVYIRLPYIYFYVLFSFVNLTLAEVKNSVLPYCLLYNAHK